MNIRIHGVQIEVTEAMKAYVEKRIEPLSKMVKDNATVCDIELARTTRHHQSGDIFKAEVNMVVEGEQMFATSEKSDLYEAIDDMRNELDRMLTTRKRKKITVFKKGAQKIKDIIKHIRRS